MREAPILGGGVYSIAEAIRILGPHHGFSRDQLRSWLRTSATFGPRDAEDDGAFLTFDDLVSLEVVARLREKHLTAWGIRGLEDRLRLSFPELMQPFAAVGLFFTDGRGSIWASLDSEGDDLVEVVGTRPQNFGQMVIAGAIWPYIAEIRVAKDSPMADSWDLSRWVEINPRVQFGRPVVTGTRVPVRVVMANLEVGSPADVAEWFGLTVEQVNGARAYATAA